MNYSEEDKKELLSVVKSLMMRANIEVRDTWKGYNGENFDDAIQNNGESGGPRLFDIISCQEGKARVEGHSIYNINGFKSAAYDNFKVHIPQRLLNSKHPIIHECVHFLQHNTEEIDKQYIPLKSHSEEDYRTYIQQRCETEAHFVQIMYIIEYENDEISLDDLNIAKSKLTECLENPDLRVDFIIYAKNKGFI